MAHGDNAKINSNKSRDFKDYSSRSKRPGRDREHKAETHRSERHNAKIDLKRYEG